MTKKPCIFLIVALTVMVFLSGCGNRASTFREFVEINPAWFEQEIADSKADVRELSEATGINMSISFEIVGEHELVLNFQIHDVIDADPSLFVEMLDSEADRFYEEAAGMRRAAGIYKLSYTVRYLNADGNLLAERTFSTSGGRGNNDARIAMITTYLIAPFGIGFLIVHFGLKNGYKTKHGVPMSFLGVIWRTIAIGALALIVVVMGTLS